MEFHEKLQHLRKQHNLTQEQLAAQLFVSRTAVSKWESGRGYPNLESLKCLSRLFSVSIDALLSNDVQTEPTEVEKRSGSNSASVFLSAALDLAAILFLFLPLLGRPDGTQIQAVALFAYTDMNTLLRILYFAALSGLSALGGAQIIFVQNGCTERLHLCQRCSIALSAAAILLSAVSRQPYMTVLLFLLFLIKLPLCIRSPRV